MFHIDPTVYTGRPADPRTPREQAVYDMLDALHISYTRVDHDHADTIEACHQVEQVLGHPICKNLFLCNRQKTAYYLLMLEGDKVFKTKDLSRQLEVSRLSFASGEDMQALLGLSPGSVTVLGLMNDRSHQVQLVIDKPIFESTKVSCHPCDSSSTLCVAMADILEKFLPHTGHTPIVVDLPSDGGR